MRNVYRGYRDRYAELQEIEKILAEAAKREANMPRRPLTAVKISDDHGNTWKLRALCSVCVDSVEPPVRLKRCGETGAGYCDWCGARKTNAV